MPENASSRQVSPALERAYQFLAGLIPTLDKFPRRQKFLLGDRIESTALDMLEGLVEATYTRNRGQLLEAVNLKLDSCASCSASLTNCRFSITAVMSTPRAASVRCWRGP
jgi:hypothetical protein